MPPSVGERRTDPPGSVRCVRWRIAPLTVYLHDSGRPTGAAQTLIATLPRMRPDPTYLMAWAASLSGYVRSMTGVTCPDSISSASAASRFR